MAQILVPPANSGYDFREAPHGVTGFEYSGNQYIFAVEGNEGLTNQYKIHVQKSTDGGATWVETGTIAFSNSSHPSIPAYTICVDGGTVYILSIDTWGNVSDPFTTDLCSVMQMWAYNLSTDGIAGPSTPTGAPQVYKFWHGATPSGFQVNKCVPLSLVRRGSGDMLLVFSGVPEAIGGSKFARLYISTFNGSTIGSPVIMPNQAGFSIAYTAGAVGVDGSGYLHVCFCSVVGGVKDYLHTAMDSGGNFGSKQTVESAGFFTHLDPPPDMSRLVVWGNNIGFVGVRDDSANGAIYFYSAAAGQLNPSWTSSSIGNTTPLVTDPRTTSCISASAAFLVDNTIHVFWCRSGVTPTWSVTGDAGCVRHVSASISDLSTWTSEVTVLDNTPVGGDWAAANVNAWSGVSQISVFGTFDQFDGTEFGNFLAVTAGTSVLSRSVSDTLSLADAIVAPVPRTDAFNDALAIVDGTPQLSLTTVPGPPGPSGGSTPPPGSGMGNCIFEFYEMQTPEDVEVLPTPKKYDQLGPMRFDKIGKIFGFRIRMIMNGATTEMPYKIYGDDSESDPTLNSIYYQGSFQVRPQIDNVYEIQFPKSVNTDICRLTLGPTTDSFHRYDVFMKVHISGMKGQAKWIPIR